MKKKTEVIQDFGSITIPDSWEKITLKQLDGLMKLQKEAETNGKILSSLDVLSLFTGKDREYLLSLPAEFISSLLARLVFLNTDIHPTPKSEITINGETYRVNYTEKLTFGEYVDTNTVMAEQPDNHAAILAIYSLIYFSSPTYIMFPSSLQIFLTVFGDSITNSSLIFISSCPYFIRSNFSKNFSIIDSSPFHNCLNHVLSNT